MTDEPRSSSFPKDISRLIQVATDAVNDLDDDGVVAVDNSPIVVRHPLKTLADGVAKRPLFAIGAALAVGFLLGVGCSSGCGSSRK